MSSLTDDVIHPIRWVNEMMSRSYNTLLSSLSVQSSDTLIAILEGSTFAKCTE